MKIAISFLCITAMLLSMLALSMPAFAASAEITTISYAQSTDDPWRADGVITVTTKEEALPQTYEIYWGNENGRLEGYTPIASYTTRVETREVNIMPNTLVPFGADRIVLYTKKNDKLSEDFVYTMLPEGAGDEDAFGEVLYQFNVMSDIHITTSNGNHTNAMFNKALREIFKLTPDCDGIFVNGDIADNGEMSEYNTLFGMLNTAKVSTKKDVPSLTHFGVGNHDTYKHRDENGDIIPMSERNQAFLEGTHNDSKTPYFDCWVGDIHFIFLADEVDGTDYGKHNEMYDIYASISDRQFAWLEQKLNESNGETPIFLFLHQGMKDTVAGTLDYQEWHGVDSQDTIQLKNLLADYPEVIMFAGHSHWAIDTPRSFVPQSDDTELPTMLNSGSFKTVKRDNGTTSSIVGQEGAHGYYIRVYKNKIVFAGRDFYNETWLSNAQYVLDWKYDISRPKEVIKETTPTPQKGETTAPTEPLAETTYILENDGGCKSSIYGISVVMSAVALISVGLAPKRRKN